jgi:hypothetical protein
MDPRIRIRIHTKMSWIRNTACNITFSKGGFFWIFLFFVYDIQHCFICRPSDSTVSEDAGIGYLDGHVGEVEGQGEHGLEQVNGGPAQVSTVHIAGRQLHLHQE